MPHTRTSRTYTYTVPKNKFNIKEQKPGGDGAHLQSQHSGADAGEPLSVRPAWSTEFQDSQGCTEKLCLKKNQKKKEKPKHRNKNTMPLRLRRAYTCHSFRFACVCLHAVYTHI